MLATLSSLVLGAGLALGPVTTEPVQVTIVADADDAERTASMLTPALERAGYTASFQRCDDFACVHAPGPDERAVIVVLSDDEDHDALVIVAPGGGTEVVVDEVEVSVPRTLLDAEAIGFAVLRGLAEPSADLHAQWVEAEQAGLERAPPPPPAPTWKPPPPPPAFDRGAFVQGSTGTTSSVSGGIPMGLLVAVEGGALLAGTSRFRGALGLRISNTTALQSDALGAFGAQARAGLGLSTGRVLALAHLGGGIGFLYGDGFTRPDLVGIASFGASLRGKVTPRLAVGVEAGATSMLPSLPLQLHALADVTVLWERRAAR